MNHCGIVTNHHEDCAAKEFCSSRGVNHVTEQIKITQIECAEERVSQCVVCRSDHCPQDAKTVEVAPGAAH